jgi:hypothetical protein
MLKFVKQNFIKMKNMLLDNDREPSDEELEMIMSEVTKDVREKSAKANKELHEKIRVETENAKLRYKKKYS